MLIEFSVTNFLSIKDEARLSLVASLPSEYRKTHLATPRLNEGNSPITIVRAAAIYGANAAGKTNLLIALHRMQKIVTKSSLDNEEFEVIPFKFDPACEDRPTTFEVIFVVDGVRYQYGFSAKTDIVEEEWLYAWPRGRVQLWFNRKISTGQDHSKWKFGSLFVGDKEVWRRATRSNALFMSTAVSLNSGQLRPIFDWFRNKLQFINPSESDDKLSLKYCSDNHRKGEIIEFLRKADFGISDIRVTSKDITPEMLPDEIPSEVKNHIMTDLSGKKLVSWWLSHDTERNQSVELPVEWESAGTRKILELAGFWLHALKNGSIVVADELHASLHPALTRFLVDCFHNSGMNQHNAQLIFSTHNTSILNQDVFRRDQIWFCERNCRQETELFSLTDFRPRKDVENLERSYLSGRYGAVPYIPPFSVASSD